MQRTMETAYPRLRTALKPRLRDAADEVIEAVVERAGLSPARAEDFLSSLAQIGSQVLPIAGTALGAAFGGPAGAALGNALGGLAGNAIGQAAGIAPVARAVPSTPATSGAPASSTPAPSAALGALLDLIARPEVQRALLAMRLGPAGTPTVSVGTEEVPVSAFSNLIGQLAQRATAVHDARYAAPLDPSYRGHGEDDLDEANPVARAEALLRLVESSDDLARRVEERNRQRRALPAPIEVYALPDAEPDDPLVGEDFVHYLEPEDGDDDPYLGGF
jgi:hypothetical protein